MADESADRTRTEDDNAELSIDASPPLKRLGDFDLLREIGRGGMGIVYEARQVSLKRRVALKVLPPALGMSAQAKQRFEREAQAAAKLHHTNIVPVHAIGEHDGHHFYAMDLIEGQSLDHVLRDMVDDGSNTLMETAVTQTATELRPQKPASPSHDRGTTSLSDTSAGGREWFDTVAKLMAEVADALHYAHGRGVIHRDVKPANLMLSSEGNLSITDFGLARLLEEPGMTVSGSFLGTPAYMAPEQIAAGRIKVDHRADIYSLGAVLYEMLTMQRPFGGQSREQVLAAVMTKDPRPPRRFNGKIPVDLETICLKALEKDVDRRYATAGEMAQDLRQYLQGGLIAARRAGMARRIWKTIRRHPVAATTLTALIVVGVLAGLNWRTLVSWREADIQRLVSDARLHLVRGDIGAALEETNAILAEDPANLDGLLIRGRVHLYRWRGWDAVRDARVVIRLDPENWEAHLLVAAAASSGDYYSIPVDEHLAVVESRAPDTADAYYLRGLLAVGRMEATGSEKREGIAWLDRALEMDPGHVQALSARAGAYSELKDLPRAMADAERLIVALPRSALGYIEKGWIYQALHDEKGALEAANRAIELDPTTGDGHNNRASIHAIRSRVDEQIADLTRAIELNPTDWRYKARAAAYQGKGEFDLAIADAERCIEINPDFARCYQIKWWSYWVSGRKEQALSALDEVDERAELWVRDAGRVWRHAFRYDHHWVTDDVERAAEEANRIIELMPRKPYGYAVRAAARRMLEGETGVEEDCDLLAALELDLPRELHSRAKALNRYCNRADVTLEAFLAAIEAAPSWADPYLARAGLHLREKRHEEALADYDRAAELAPNWLYARSQRAEAYLRLERFEESLAEIERLTELGDEDSNLRWNQAQALHRLGRSQEALSVLDDYLEEHSGDVVTLQRRAKLLFGLGRLDDAIVSLDRAVESNPNDGWSYLYRSTYSMLKPRQCDRALADLKKAEQLMPAENVGMWSRVSQVHTEFAYHLCPGHYDFPRALELARRAADFNTQSALFKLTLGMALYRNGSFEEARAALQEAVELEDRADALHLFFLAMASRKLGLESEAASYYERAVARMEETWPKSPEYDLIKDEAAEILGQL